MVEMKDKMTATFGENSLQMAKYYEFMVRLYLKFNPTSKTLYTYHEQVLAIFQKIFHKEYTDKCSFMHVRYLLKNSREMAEVNKNFFVPQLLRSCNQLYGFGDLYTLKALQHEYEYNLIEELSGSNNSESGRS
jgi:hypothetical protein